MTRAKRTTNTIRTLLSLIAALCLILVATPARAMDYTPPGVSPFKDVAVDAASFKEIAWMSDRGISTGWDDGTFRPNEQVDRDAMAAFIYRLDGSPQWQAPANSPFSDISSRIMFYHEMTWLESERITTGWPDGTYRPWATTFRDAMSAFIYRVAGSPDYTPPEVSPFTDIDPTIQFYKEMCWMAEMGIANGIEDGTYDPWEPVTREMMAVFMYRLAANVLNLPTPSAGVLSVQNTSAGATWTADFDAAVNGSSVRLQMQTIATTMTPELPTSSWLTIATGTANAGGDATFPIADPLGVKHQYRAVAGTGVTRAMSNEVTYAAPRPDPGTGLAAVYLDTNEGAPIDSRDVYREGRITITAGSANGSTSGTSCAVLSDRLLKVKGRGHSSWEELDKKGFNFSLDAKANVCGMGSAKKWALLANHVDRSLLRNATAMKVGSLFTNLEYTPKSIAVDLYVNGAYRGSYTLMERVNLGKGRVEIDELKDNQGGVNDGWPNVTGGYLLEWDFRQAGDHNINVNNSGAWVAINEPEDEDDGSGITSTQIGYISDYLAEADDALFAGNFTDDNVGWKKYIDASSAVDYYIAMELMKPIDGNMHTSVFMYKKRDVTTEGDGKLFFGPLWDFDIAMGNENNPGNQGSATGWYLRDPNFIEKTQVDVSWFNRLNDDPDFQQLVAERWDEVYPQLVDVDSFIESQRTLIAQSASKNFTIWDVRERLYPEQVIQGSWSAEVDHLESWLAQRIDWMNGQYS